MLNRCLVSAVTIVGVLFGAGAMASASEPDVWSNWLTQFKPPDVGRPETAGNGSSRRPLSCSPDEAVMTPLLPADRFGLTLKDHPQIFVDMPETSAKQVFLTFRGESTEDYHQTLVPITNQTGWVGFGLPDNAPALTPGVTYEWSLTLICGDFMTLNDPIVTGWVHRAEVDTSQTMDNAPEAMAQWFSENGYWYDLVDLVADRSYYSRALR